MESEDCFTNRQQYVSLGGMKSSREAVVCGVSQGSSLGPLLMTFPTALRSSFVEFLQQH